VSIVNTLDKVAKWAQANICKDVKLKLPDDDKNDGTYNVKLVNPEAFVLYVPTKDRMPPQIAAPIPSLCVQLIEGTDDMIKSISRLKMRFSLSAWNPGMHKEGELFLPQRDEAGNLIYTVWTGSDIKEKFQRNSEGWRDVWTFADVAIRKLENAEFIEGLRLVKEDGVIYGPYQEEGAFTDFYPYWFAWVSFTIEYGLSRTAETYQQYL
jgi:hypothetical protein